MCKTLTYGAGENHDEPGHEERNRRQAGFESSSTLHNSEPQHDTPRFPSMNRKVFFTVLTAFHAFGGIAWLVYASLILSCCGVKAQDNGMQYQIPDAEYNALVDLYNATGGDGWSQQDGWLDPDATSWYGVYVEGVQYDTNGNVVAEGNVTELYLYNNQLSGPIPDSLGNLGSLQMLNLGWNQLNGWIPDTLGNLVNLQELLLNINQLSGWIPDSLANLGNLRLLWLNENQLSGWIPDALGNLVNLQYLMLNNNQLIGWIPDSLGNLVNLQFLQLDDNQLIGWIPDTLGNLVNLQYLTLINNQLSGWIPDTLGNLVNLQELLLNKNQLSGWIPDSLAPMPVSLFYK
jgi:Leucine-rich repeat (LRR) protein